MINLTVNGEAHRWDGDPSLPLLWFLRDELGLTGALQRLAAGTEPRHWLPFAVKTQSMNRP